MDVGLLLSTIQSHQLFTDFSHHQRKAFSPEKLVSFDLVMRGLTEFCFFPGLSPGFGLVKVGDPGPWSDQGVTPRNDCIRNRPPLCNQYMINMPSNLPLSCIFVYSVYFVQNKSYLVFSLLCVLNTREEGMLPGAHTTSLSKKLGM